MHNECISIIIPIYNMEEFLSRCIESLINQSYSNIEILLINDGSIDNSGQICEVYAAKDKRIKVFHKNNGGVSSARNVGLANAKGKYVVFCDADDIYYLNAIEKMCMATDSYPESLCVFNIDIENRFDKTFSNFDKKLDLEFSKTDDIFYEMLINEKFNTPCAKMYNLSLIKDKNISFKENIKMGEDFVFFTDYIKYADTVYMNGKSVYLYFWNAQSAVRSLRLEYLNDIDLQIEIINKIVEKTNYNDIFTGKLDLIYNVMLSLKRQKYKNSVIKKEIFSLPNLKLVLNKKYKNKKITIKKIIIKYLNYDLYYLFYRLYEKLKFKK